MENVTLPVYTSDGEKIDQIELDGKVFGEKAHAAAVYQAINAYMANRRKGLAATKTRGEVSGGGRKPWKQKGTGRARVGSTRSPLWRHGGVVFGPHPRDFSYTLPQKLKNLALRSALFAKVQENNLIVVDALNLDKPNTKAAAKVLSNLKVYSKKKVPQKVLLLLEVIQSDLRRAVRNISTVHLALASDANAYLVLESRKLVVTRGAFTALLKRLNPVRNAKHITGQRGISNGTNK